MDLALGALVACGALGFVLYPLLWDRAPEEQPEPRDAESPAVRRAAIYQEILDLELERRTDKLDAADYEQLREACLARAAALLAEEEAEVGGLDERIEREVARLRAQRQGVRPESREP
jgi:hypothetical protein